MAKIYIHETGIASDVKEATKLLYGVFNKELEEYGGKIWIIPSVDMHQGTGVHDIDILLMGYLEDYYIDDIAGYDNINIKSFCTTIEAKAHGADGIYREGTQLWVQYSAGNKNVTEQNEKQKETLKKFLSESLQYKKERIPWVTNVIMLTGIDYDDFDETVGLTNSNILTSDFCIEEFFETIGRSSYLKNNGYIDAFRGYTHSDIEKVANIFCAKSEGVDTMTLRRINLLQQTNKDLSNIEQSKEKIIVISGHAGTGKTIMLLQTADFLSKKGHKCLFLTYNTALISDLKHTMMHMPKGLSDIKMESMHSFMISLLFRQGLWGKGKSIDKDFIAAMNTLARTMKSSRINFDYEYIFVDEAQDWEKPIPEVLKYVFFNSQIVIADGIDQFMRTSEHTHWGSPYVPVMKKCLRQRRNLTVFAKIFAAKMGVYWDVEPNTDLPGGKVIIKNQYTPEDHKAIIEYCKEHNCTEYDLMLLVPNSLVNNGKFAHAETYAKAGMPVFDGVDKDNRDKIYDLNNANNHECRVYTYESCRGLEAWATVCLRFGELFTEEHPHDYKVIEYSMARDYMLTLWTLIPLTRAVDRLVLIVKPEGKIHRLLKELAKENPDFITYE